MCENSDICLIQENWLMKEDLPILSTVHSKFHDFGVSAIASSKILVGRPLRGVAILWRKLKL